METCLDEKTLQRITSMLDSYREQLKGCTSTEEVVKVYQKMDVWCVRSLSKAKSDGSQECIEFYTRLRDASTVDAVKAISVVNDGVALKEISYRIGIYWDARRIKEALEAVDSIEAVSSDGTKTQQQKAILYLRPMQLLKNKLMVATPTERLHIVLKWKNGASILSDSWRGFIKQYQNLSPTEVKEKEKSSAKREREDDALKDAIASEGGVLINPLGNPDAAGDADYTDVVPLYPTGYATGVYKPWHLLTPEQKRYVLIEVTLGGVERRQHLLTSTSVENLNMYTQQLYDRLELFAKGENSKGEKLSHPKHLRPMDDDLLNYAHTYIFRHVRLAVIRCLQTAANEKEKHAYRQWFKAYCKDLGLDETDYAEQLKKGLKEFENSKITGADEHFAQVALVKKN